MNQHGDKADTLERRQKLRPSDHEQSLQKWPSDGMQNLGLLDTAMYLHQNVHLKLHHHLLGGL